MFRSLGRIIGLLVLIVAGSWGLYVYQDRYSATHKIEKLQEEKLILELVVQRLSDERRIADVMVTDQREVDGVTRTTLLFVEYDKNGKPLPAKSFDILGEIAHIDAMRIKFDRHFISEGDPLRGHSIALFTRIYGDQQKPAEGQRIDKPGEIPVAYQGADPRITQFEMELWKNFWKLADDPHYRSQFGVTVADGQGTWRPVKPGVLYTVSIESDGGLSTTSEPLRGIYLEALRSRAQID